MNEAEKYRELDFERISFFYSNFKTTMLGMYVAVAFIGIGIHHFLSTEVAIAWGLSVIITYIPRILVSISFARKLEKRELTPDNIKPWIAYSVWGSLVPYLCFTAALFLPYQQNTEIAILFCTVFIVLLMMGGTIAYSTVIAPLLLFMNITLPALIIRCLWEGGFLLTTLAIAVIISHILLTRLIFRLHRAMKENISMKLDSRHQSYVDPLTKLWNRRRLHLLLDILVPSARRGGNPFSIILLDIDHFKSYNDRLGHNAGDKLLIELSNILRNCAREQDLVVRYGGEEFMLVLPSTELGEARVLARRINENVKAATDVTISAGLEEYSGDMDIEQMIQRADRALYAAKSAGRDRLVEAGSLPAECDDIEPNLPLSKQTT